MIRKLVAAGGALALTVFGLTAPGDAAVGTDTTALQDAVTIGGMVEHLEALQAIADANGGTRAAGTNGYDASVEYVMEILTAAGYNVSTDPFLFDRFEELADPVFERLTPTARTYIEDDDFATMDYSGSGDVTGVVVRTNDLVLPPGAAPSTSNSGCEPADFPPAPVGPAIALAQRGTCDFTVKAANAEAAGYDAVIIFNEGTPGFADRITTLFGTLAGDPASVPVLGTSFAVGNELAGLAAQGPVTARIVTETLIELDVPSVNVIADSVAGRGDRTVVVGAHLDSVPEGPGINDNGTGTAALLEIAEEMSELGVEPRNRVRFAFWGAEEAGLLGSTDYVATRTARELKDIALNLNFDMLGSPNYVPFVYDGDGDETGTAGPNGSARIEQVFHEAFAQAGVAPVATAFDGRSDYGPFIDVGIPAGGLFSGAEGIKTAGEAAEYGGTAGVAYDPCYHQACDTFANATAPLSLDSLQVLGDATAHSVLTFAMTTSAVNGTSRASGHAASNLERQGDAFRR